MAKDERIRFPSGSYQALYKGICYRIDPENDAVEMTKRLNLRYSSESKEAAINLVNELGAERINKRVNIFSKLLLASILLFLFLTLLPVLFSGKSEALLSVGRFITVISEIAVLHQLDQKIIYPHYDFKYLTEKYFEIGMKLNDFSIQLVKY